MSAPETVAEGRATLEAWLAEERDTQLAFIRDFARIDTTNPPGDTREGAAFIAGFLRQRVGEPAVVDPQPTMPNLVAHVDGAAPGRHLVLNGHIDVFPVGERSHWTQDPFGGAIVDGRLFGRGVVDMKCGTTASLFAFTYLARLRHLLKGRLTMTAVSDEETGGYWGADYLLRELTDEVLGDCVLNGEPSSVDTVRFGEKSILWLRFRIRTAGGHGAYPHLSPSATRIAADLIGDLAEIEAIAPATPPNVAAVLNRPEVRAAIEKGLGRGAADVVGRVTLNIGIVKGGTSINMIADECVVDADARLPIGVSVEEVVATAETIAARHPGATVERLQQNVTPPNWCDPEGEMMGIVRRNVRASIGIDPQPIVNLGGTDCRFWRVRGIPAYVHGCSPAGMGAPDESLDLEEFLHVVRVHTLSAYDYLTVE